MGFFDNFGEKLQDVAKKSGELAEKSAKKSGELLEITKLKMKIKEVDNEINDKYKEMGKYLYEQYEKEKSILPEPIQELADLIYVKKAAIEELNLKIADIKNAENQTEPKEPLDMEPTAEENSDSSEDNSNSSEE